jgi:hypothetical protein
MNSRATFLVLVLITLELLGPTSRSLAADRDVLIRGIPHVKQRDDFCGEACAEMVLRKLGKKGSQDDVFNLSGLDPALGRGCYSADLKRALDRIGFKTGDVFYHVDSARAEAGLEAQWNQLHADLLKGHPTIVCMRYDASLNTTEHMRLVVGYDPRTDSIVYLDPADRIASHRKMTRSEFLSLWPLKYETARWLIIRFRMEPGEIRAPVATRGFTNADYAQHVLALKKRLPEGFCVFIEPPFVVVGDGSPQEVKAICDRTVRWAVSRLKRDYFARDPDEIITVWLFKDDDSYRTYTKSVFGDTPTTPYGYYSAAHRALIMNIATGTGTLVHEIVHPYVRANFPRCPAWLNEGLGSLYEQCGERDGHIVGYPNWRLPGLQRAIRAGGVPTFEELTGTSTSEFYGDDKGTNYSQARYLCYYLQEQGKLTTFYREFVANQTTDPTGYRTLIKTLGEPDMAAFQEQWEAYVLALHR